MIEELKFKEYRKLKEINISFSKYINVLAGTNGTNKSSILHLISNSFKKVVKSDLRINDDKSLDVINRMNKLTNPKIESLTRGDKKYNNPSTIKGELFKTLYLDGNEISFRRHNSDDGISKRFAIKPQYPEGKNEKLPSIPVIYLGLFRLFSYGEYKDDNLIKNIPKKLPNDYLKLLKDLYKDFTNYTVELENMRDMGNIKNRVNFETDTEGVDSNTISAGEDNLFIILFALTSLKYYFDSIESHNEVESILLIDELDASLHPEFQVKLFELFKEYSKEYKIQFFFTTHSLSLLEYAISQKNDCNVCYLLDNVQNVKKMKDPDIHKINMWLRNITKNELYLENKIPIISEDQEARDFINLLFTFYKEKNDVDLGSVFHLVDGNFSSETIRNLVSDDLLLKTTLRAIFILDGDQTGQTNLNKNLMILPGNNSPEKILFQYASKLYNDNEENFWDNEVLFNSGFTKKQFQSVIKPRIDNIEEKLEKPGSNKGVERELNKKLYKDYLTFWKFVAQYWIKDERNFDDIRKFYNNLNIVFMKTAEFHGISSNEWRHSELWPS